MFERSLLDFQNERLKLITWSLDANHNIKNETGKGSIAFTSHLNALPRRLSRGGGGGGGCGG